jgi:hypothetical protein
MKVTDCEKLKRNKTMIKTIMNPLFCAAGPLGRARSLACGLLLGLMITAKAHAQGDIPSGTIAGTGSGPYSYSLTFSDAAGATSPVGSVWYARVPGAFFLPSSPTSASAPAGWTAKVVGDSVQFVASSSAFDIAAGGSLSGFGYIASFSPSTLAAAPNSGVSVAYSGGLFSDGGETFTVQSTPEPSPSLLLATGAAALFFVRCRLAGTKAVDGQRIP